MKHLSGIVVSFLYFFLLILAKSFGRMGDIFLSVILITCYVIYYYKKKITVRDKKNINYLSYILAIFLGIGIAFMHSFNSLIPMSPEAMKVFSNVKYDMFDYIYICLLCPITEEIIYRGIIFKSYINVSTVRKAIVLSAILFSITHMNIWQMSTTLITGGILAYLYYIADNIKLPIIVHITISTCAVSGFINTMYLNVHKHMGEYLSVFVIGTFGCLLTIAMLYIVKKCTIIMINN